MIDTIVIEPAYGGREALKTIEVGPRLGYKVRYGKRSGASGEMPLGSVEWVEEWLGFLPRPDYYPIWLKDWVHRTMARRLIKPDDSFSVDWFMKPADSYKRFDARIVPAKTKPPKGDVWMSEVVKFVQEWRYYVANGTVLTTGWYDGHDEDEPAPELDIAWPSHWCGAADFGRLDDGRIALVECQHPYAIGWYGDDHEAYVRFLVDGWKSIMAAHEWSARMP